MTETSSASRRSMRDYGQEMKSRLSSLSSFGRYFSTAATSRSLERLKVPIEILPKEKRSSQRPSESEMNSTPLGTLRSRLLEARASSFLSHPAERRHLLEEIRLLLLLSLSPDRRSASHRLARKSWRAEPLESAGEHFLPQNYERCCRCGPIEPVRSRAVAVRFVQNTSRTVFCDSFALVSRPNSGREIMGTFCALGDLNFD